MQIRQRRTKDLYAGISDPLSSVSQLLRLRAGQLAVQGKSAVDPRLGSRSRDPLQLLRGKRRRAFFGDQLQVLQLREQFQSGAQGGNLR